MLTRLQSWLHTLTRKPAAARRGKARRTSADLEMLMHNSHDMIMRLNKDIRLSYISPACLQIFGRPPEEMLGRKLKDYALEEDKPLLTERGKKLFSGQTESDTSCFRILRADGAIRWVEVNTRAERDLKGNLTGHFVIIARDVTRHRELEAQLDALARIDALTGIANRRAFDEALERAWRGALRSQLPLSLLLLDFDNFKKYNDTYGHQAGDDCLRRGAGAVAGSAKRPADLAARYGGEELAVILPETDGTGAVDVATRILAAVRDLQIPHEQNPPGGGFVSVSIGIASAMIHDPAAVSTQAALVDAADQALYRAKSQGRNGLAMAPPILVAPKFDLAAGG
jgi:diguanylate cyclase (GGDEF)-like protein/PAS domain S-box-containing protein